MRPWSWLCACAVVVALGLGCSAESASSRGGPGHGAGGTVSGQSGTSGRSGGGNGGATAGNGGATTGNGGATAGNGGATRGNGGQLSAGRGAEAGHGAAGSAGDRGGGGMAGSDVASGAAAGAPEVPSDWQCPKSAYGDGKCHCGCGAEDSDCDGSVRLADCEVCDALGSCNPVGCPGRIDRGVTTRCQGPPAQWTCAPSSYADGQCDCGCGVTDFDCEGAAASACPIPPAWRCQPSRYGDGTTCDCGCGAPDPDCHGSDLPSCDNCFACSNSDCPGSVSADDTTRCDLPSGWKCGADTYGDGICDCGCGAMDDDCPPNYDTRVCERCPDGGCSRGQCQYIADDNLGACFGTPP